MDRSLGDCVRAFSVNAQANPRRLPCVTLCFFAMLAGGGFSLLLDGRGARRGRAFIFSRRFAVLTKRSSCRSMCWLIEAAN
jgi:hypothetical protein